jgi:hypothetical protein
VAVFATAPEIPPAAKSAKKLMRPAFGFFSAISIVDINLFDNGYE